MGLGEVVKSVYGNLKGKVDIAKNYLPSPKYLIAASAISLGLTFGYNDKARSLDNIPISSASLNQEQPSMAFDGLNYLVAWRDARGGSGNNVYCQRVDKLGDLVGSEIPILSPTNVNDNPVVGFDGINYMVVWCDYNGTGSADIYGQLVDINGNLVNNIFTVSNASNEQEYPEIAFDGINYLVVWDDRRGAGPWDIYGQLVAPDGSLVGGEIPIYAGGGTQTWPQVAFGGANYLVVWQDSRSGNYDVWGRFVGVSGSLVGGDFLIATGSNNQWNPSISSDGVNYLVAWQDRNDPDARIEGQLVASNGSLVGSKILIADEPDWQEMPNVIFGDGRYLVMYHDEEGPEYDIYGQYVNLDGSLGDRIAVTTASGKQYFPRVIFNGVSYFAVWGDNRNGDSNWDIYGQKIGTDTSSQRCFDGNFGDCFDGIDNDGNGLTDWDDKRACYTRGRFDPYKSEGVGNCCDGIDNDGDKNADGRDPECINEFNEYDVYKDEAKVTESVPLPLRGSGLVGILLGLLGIGKLGNFNKRDYFKFNRFRRSE